MAKLNLSETHMFVWRTFCWKQITCDLCLNTALQIALFYGAKYKSIEKMMSGNVRDNFEFVKGYQVQA